MAQSFDTNLDTVAANYILQLGVPVTKETIKKRIVQNSYYPSLYSLSNTFDTYKIENAAFKIDTTQLLELPTPFIAHTNSLELNTDWVLVTEVNNSTISFNIDEKTNKTLANDEFIRGWKNIFFVANVDKTSGDRNYTQQLKLEQKQKNKKQLLFSGAVFILLVAIIHLFATSNNIISASLISILLLSGLIVTTLLLIYDIDKTNTFVKNICTSGGKTNCDAVLSSKASKILGISWSEAGWFYFAGFVLFLLLPFTSFEIKLPFIAVVSILAALYIPFSIYYQYKIVKQWCPLCLATQVILFLQLCWAFIFFWQSPYFLFNLSPSIFFILCLLFPILVWFSLKPVFLKAKQAPEFEAAHKRLLYNPDIFNSLLQQQQQAPDGWQNIGISIGNLNAATTIIKVCNPYCGPCAKLHPILEDIIKHNENINLKIIFNTTNNEYDENAARVVKHLLSINVESNHQKTQRALDDWYLADKKDYDVLAKKHPVNMNVDEQKHEIDNMSGWFRAAEIRYTPTIFINGHRLPETYSIDELKNIL